MFYIFVRVFTYSLLTFCITIAFVALYLVICDKQRGSK